MRLFRKNENTNTKAYVDNLNELIRISKKIENMRVGKGLSLKQNKNRIQILTNKRNFNGTASSSDTNDFDITWIKITKTLKYLDGATEDPGVSAYTAFDLNDNNRTVTPKILTNTESFDLRDFVPWLEVGDIVPAAYITLNNPSGASGVNFDNLYILQTFSYVGDNTEKSISWNEDSGRLMSVYS